MPPCEHLQLDCFAISVGEVQVASKRCEREGDVSSLSNRESLRFD